MTKTARVWVVLDRVAGVDGPSLVEVPLLNTVRRTRKECQFAYTASGTPGCDNGFWAMQKAGWARVVRATLTLAQPKSTKRKPRRNP